MSTTLVRSRLLLIVCVVAAVLIHRNGTLWLFGFAALTAFLNLLSSHFICALDSCSSRQDPPSFRDPVHLSALVHRITGFIGIALLGYALVSL